MEKMRMFPKLFVDMKNMTSLSTGTPRFSRVFEFLLIGFALLTLLVCLQTSSTWMRLEGGIHGNISPSRTSTRVDEMNKRDMEVD